jgi:GNAT superfamily N-acetyltransferase
MSEYRISIKIQPDSNKLDFIDKQLHAFNVGKIGDYKYTPLYLFLENSEHDVVGGLDGFMGLGWLNIATLWIIEELRGCGYGKALLLAAEQEATADCKLVKYKNTPP